MTLTNSTKQWEPEKVLSLMTKVKLFLMKLFKKSTTLNPNDGISYVVMDAVDNVNKLYLAGQLSNSGIKVYVNQSVNKNTMLVGYKAKQQLSTGYIYAPSNNPYWEVTNRKYFDFN